MSGSGSSGFGGGFESGEVNCGSLVLNTQLASPQPAVIRKLKVGDVLPVELQTMDATTAIVIRYQAEVAGAVAAPNMQRLRQCIEGGTPYQAEVTAISGAQVSIRISAA